MQRLWAIYKREILSYFSTPVAYVFLIIFTLSSIFRAFQNNFFSANVCSMRAFFQDLPWILLFFVPAIAMRLWSEERRTNSIEFLFTLPITSTQAVLGKFLAAWTILTIGLIATWTLPITLAILGSPDWGTVIGGYLASFLLCGFFLSISATASALTRAQVIAFILGVVLNGLFLLLGSPQMLNMVAAYSSILADLLENFSCWNHFDALERGVIEFRNLLFFVILITAFLITNIWIIEERKAA